LPGDLLSREEGTIVKDWGGRLPIALVYPNSYYLGMSNLGIHAIYKLLNSRKNVVCERVFWEKENREKYSPPLALESKRPLPDFTVIAFSISYELDYFAIVPMLRAAGIPAYARDRDERYPLIIAGGPCIMANPAPISPFFDALCLGEAEPMVPHLLTAISQGMTARRDDLLKALTALPGVYVPTHHSGETVARQRAENLDDFPVTSAILTPETELGEMYLIEVARGCKWSCRFCLVSTAFKPMRYRSLDNLLMLSGEGLRYRKRLGLMGADVSDYPHLEKLLIRLEEMGAQFSISSLRVNRVSDRVLEALVRGGAETITLAPEAGSERLRQSIKKGVCEDDVLRSMERVAALGVPQVKLYFMIGLPQETDEDIDEIIRLTLKCKAIIEKKKSRTRITLNIAPFVPKAGTFFQKKPMAPLDVLKQRLAILEKRLSAKGISLKAESPDWSQVQAVLSRADAKAADVLASVDRVSLSAWRQAVVKSRFDADFYAHKEWCQNQRLPWGFIS